MWISEKKIYEYPMVWTVKITKIVTNLSNLYLLQVAYYSLREKKNKARIGRA